MRGVLFMRGLLTILASLFSMLIFGQKEIDDIMVEINAVYMSSAGDPNKGKIYFNLDSKTLDIEDNQINIFDIKMSYDTRNTILQGIKIAGYVKFNCDERIKFNNCISTPDKNASARGFAFKEKGEAYRFINLIKKLKDKTRYY
ncbi:hypothetical protein [[Muricauda] lutisoli]|uniref:Uncharacterized protein n=1 Tax=[Muricauda] lutisoli TaxID=2816035 RepID=A0ABS3EXZ4_9FLAO|nr:hypothetical protein [[Muricauda] lutisoli]MBO0331129.1 hypothetical protein [[Muricauda] lutisoli]